AGLGVVEANRVAGHRRALGARDFVDLPAPPLAFPDVEPVAVDGPLRLRQLVQPHRHQCALRRRTTQLTCRAACKTLVPRDTGMAARSGAAPGSAATRGQHERTATPRP